MRLLAALLLFGTSLAGAQEPLQVRLPPALDPAARIDDAVRRECTVEATVGNYLFGALRRRYPGAVQVAREDAARELRLTILSAMDGANAISVRAELVEHGKPVAANVFTQEAKGGGSRGACSTLAHVAAAVGGHIAAWASGSR